MESLKCKNNCCILNYTNKKIPRFKNNKSQKIIKAGLIIFDNKKRLLLSQSYNEYWGIPKGNCESEDFILEAQRETFEETGIIIPDEILFDRSLTKPYIFYIFNKIYILYSVNIKSCKELKTRIPNFLENESTGCGWLSIDCIWDLIEDKTIKVNNMTKKVIDFLEKYDN
jgi:8-oxo-dGTP pyrophosphatase MutT (NUDIX family)